MTWLSPQPQATKQGQTGDRPGAYRVASKGTSAPSVVTIEPIDIKMTAVSPFLPV